MVRNRQGASRRSRRSQQRCLRDLDFGGSPRRVEAPGRTKHREVLEEEFAKTEEGSHPGGGPVGPTPASRECGRWTTIRRSGTRREVSTPKVRSTNAGEPKSKSTSKKRDPTSCSPGLLQ